jgi:hypothetical protein
LLTRSSSVTKQENETAPKHLLHPLRQSFCATFAVKNFKTVNKRITKHVITNKMESILSIYLKIFTFTALK